MILWWDGAHGPRENMRRDSALLEAGVADRIREPVLRLFRFSPAGITLGRSQAPERELDLAALEAQGVEWAMRPTGGRAIFHDEEWTFSLTTRLGPEGWAPDAAQAYARTCSGLARALVRLGVPVESSAGTARGVGRPRAESGPAAPCFASTARHELTLQGRKFAGIAQRQVGETLLQQGSLLLGDSHLRLLDWTPVEASSRAEARRELLASAAHAAAWLGADHDLGRLAAACDAEFAPREFLRGEAGASQLGVLLTG